MEIPQTIHGDARTEGCSLKTESGVPLPKKTSAQLIEFREIELVPIWVFYPSVLISLVWEDTL